MMEFNFLKTVYVYRLAIDEDKIETASKTKLLKTEEQIDEYIRLETSQSSTFTDDYLYIKRCSFKPDDKELAKEMKMELLIMYNKYLDYLSKNLENAKNIRDSLFKNELRILKMRNLDNEE